MKGFTVDERVRIDYGVVVAALIFGFLWPRRLLYWNSIIVKWITVSSYGGISSCATLSGGVGMFGNF